MLTLTENTAANATVLLTLSASGLPATGIAHTALTVELSKAGGAFSPKVMTALNWTEVGNGVYTLALSATDTNTLGDLIVTVNAATVTQFVVDAEVVTAAQASSAVELLTCILSGYVIGLGGQPMPGQGVFARLVGTTWQGSIGVGDSVVATKTNENGQFFLTLARLAEVQVSIPAMNFSRLLTVPNAASADLFTIP